MISCQKIDGEYRNLVPDTAPEGFKLKECLCRDWKHWKCAGYGMFWEHKDDILCTMSPTFKEWHSLTPGERKAKSESFWVLVDGWWKPRWEPRAEIKEKSK